MFRTRNKRYKLETLVQNSNSLAELRETTKYDNEQLKSYEVDTAMMYPVTQISSELTSMWRERQCSGEKCNHTTPECRLR
jgi:hypothetical protein